MHAWVTGATGQIGQKLTSELVNLGYEVTAFSRQMMKSTDKRHCVKWDLSSSTYDFSQLRNPTVVFHLAAQTSAYQARNDLPSDVLTNVSAFVNLLDAVRRTGTCPHVISIGAATEVGMTANPVITDLDPDDPLTFYDVGKVAQRLYLRQCDAEGWLDGTTIRLPNVYGGATHSSSDERGFINQCIRRALMGNELTYYSDGEYIRDYLHVDDVVRALISVINSRSEVAGETFVIGTGTGTRVRDALAEIARQAEEITGALVKVGPSPPPAGMYEIERRDAIVDSSRFTKKTGWQPELRLAEGLKLTFRQFTP